MSRELNYGSSMERIVRKRIADAQRKGSTSMPIVRIIESYGDSRRVVDEYPPDADSAEVIRMGVHEKVFKDYGGVHTIRFTDEGLKWTFVIVGGSTITVEIADSFDPPEAEDA